MRQGVVGHGKGAGRLLKESENNPSLGSMRAGENEC